MAITKIEEVYLYVSEKVTNAAENIQALAFMERAGIPYKILMYNDEVQHQEIFQALNSWWADRNLPTLSTFPFITYVEVHDDIPARSSPVMYLQGLDNIKNIVDIFNLRTV